MLTEPTQRILSGLYNDTFWLACWTPSPLGTFLILHSYKQKCCEYYCAHDWLSPFRVIAPKEIRHCSWLQGSFYESMGCKGGNTRGHTVGQVLDIWSASLGVLSSPLCPALNSRLLVFMIVSKASLNSWLPQSWPVADDRAPGGDGGIGGEGVLSLCLVIGCHFV